MDHPGWIKQQDPPPPGLDHPGTRGGQAPTKGASDADQAGGAAATPDWSIQGQVAEDAPDQIILGKTRRRGHNSQDTISRGTVA